MQTNTPRLAEWMIWSDAPGLAVQMHFFAERGGPIVARREVRWASGVAGQEITGRLLSSRGTMSLAKAVSGFSHIKTSGQLVAALLACANPVALEFVFRNEAMERGTGADVEVATWHAEG